MITIQNCIINLVRFFSNLALINLDLLIATGFRRKFSFGNRTFWKIFYYLILYLKILYHEILYHKILYLKILYLKILYHEILNLNHHLSLLGKCLFFFLSFVRLINFYVLNFKVRYEAFLEIIFFYK